MYKNSLFAFIADQIPLVDGGAEFKPYLIFCLVVLLVIERGIFKSPTILVDFSISSVL